jgi:hypothetical protein
MRWQAQSVKVVSAKERELLQGMVNCYNSCHANFDETVGMVGSARGLGSEEVKATLERLRKAGGEDYRALRTRLPADFPL